MKSVKVAFQGERGAFSELASRKFFPRNASLVPCESFAKLFTAVTKRRADYGVIPIENSLIGSIHQNYDLLVEHNLSVIGETYVRIEHCLIAAKGTPFSSIRRVFSHPAALEQCRDFFRNHSKITPTPFYDTAGAIKMIAEKKPLDAAAIAGPHAAKLYGLSILRKSLEDSPNNYTRFLLLSKKPMLPSGTTKTSIVFAVKNEPGILFKMLSVFALRDIDLTKIESRPVPKKAWEYYFYLDFVGSQKEERVKFALEHLRELTQFIRVLGSYKSAKTPGPTAE